MHPASMANQRENASRAETEMSAIDYSTGDEKYRYVQMQKSKVCNESVSSVPINPPVFSGDLQIRAEKLVLQRDRWACWVKVVSLVYGTFALIDLLLLLVYSNRFGSSYQVLILQTILDCGMIFASWLGNKTSKLKERKSAKLYFKTLVFFGSLYLVYLFMILISAPYHEISSHILWETGFGRRLTQENRIRNDSNFNNQFEPATGQNFLSSMEDLRNIQLKNHLSNQEMLNFYSWISASKLSITSENTLEVLMSRYLEERNNTSSSRNLRKTQEVEETQSFKEDTDDSDDIDEESCNHPAHARRRERVKKIEFVESIVKFCAAIFYLCAVSIFTVCFVTGIKLYNTSALLEKQFPIYSMAGRSPAQVVMFRP